MSAQSPSFDAGWTDSVLILAGHGSSQHPASGEAVRRHAEAVRARGLFAEVRACFWKEPPFLFDALDGLSERCVYVVPVLASRGFITETVIPREIGFRENGNVTLCEPVGVHPGLPAAVAGFLSDVIREQSIDADRVTILLVGHGNQKNPASAEQTDSVAKAVAAIGGFPDVATAFLENPPYVTDWADMGDATDIIVIPYMIAGGLHAARDIPEILGIEPDDPSLQAKTDKYACAGPYDRKGRRVWYCRPVGEHPFIEDMILDQIRAAAKDS
ncbi:MAG: hypothetical protein OQK07_08005 [Rhodospirillales bacterium]|nr:hypothetical protein [Rhodospirillales bacterium]